MTLRSHGERDAALGVQTGKRDSRAATLAALTLAASAETWTTSGVSLTLTDLTGTLSASSDEASWALTVYTTAFAISVALSHRLSLRFGNRRYLTGCALLYALASIGCMASPQLWVFLFFRAFAGFAGGAFLVRAFVFFSQQYEVSARAQPSVIFAIAYFSLGRVMSPIVCGWLADVASWRYLFIFETLLMLVAAWIFHRYTADHWMAEVTTEPLDGVGIVLLILGAACVQTALNRGEVDGWFESSTLIALLLTGLIGNIAFALWQLSRRNRYPLLNLAFLDDRSARAGAILGFAIGILLAGSLYVVPQYLRGIETHSALQTGFLLSIGGAAAVFVLCGFRLVVSLLTKLGGGTVLAMALVSEIVSQLLFARHLTPDTPDYFLWLPLALNGIFIALSVPTLGIVAFAAIKNEQASNARAMYYGSRQLGASVGVTFASILIDRRMSFHSSRLLDAIANRDASIIGPTVTNLSDRVLSNLVRRQSAVLSYADVFYAMTLVAVITLVLIPLLPSPSQPNSTANNRTEEPNGSTALSGHLQGVTEAQ